MTDTPNQEKGLPEQPATIRTVSEPKKLGWRLRLIGYPVILVAAVWWAWRDPGVIVVSPSVWSQPLNQLSREQYGKALPVPRPKVADFPAGHLVLFWWDGQPSLAFAPLPGEKTEPHHARLWQESLTPSDLPDMNVLNRPLRDVWLEIPLVPWPQGWKLLVRKGVE